MLTDDHDVVRYQENLRVPGISVLCISSVNLKLFQNKKYLEVILTEAVSDIYGKNFVLSRGIEENSKWRFKPNSCLEFVSAWCWLSLEPFVDPVKPSQHPKTSLRFMSLTILQKYLRPIGTETHDDS